MKKILNCFIVDDHPMMRQGLKAALAEVFPDLCHIKGEAASVDEAVERLQGLWIDVLIVDHSLQGKTGLDLVSLLSQSHPHIRFLIVTQSEDIKVLHHYREFKVSAIVSKISSNEDLAKSIEAIQNGKIFYSESIQALLKQQPPESSLTVREVEVVRLVALGKTNKEVASLLDCSVETIKTHKSNIFAKLKISNSVEISVWAMKQGLI